MKQFLLPLGCLLMFTIGCGRSEVSDTGDSTAVSELEAALAKAEAEKAAAEAEAAKAKADAKAKAMELAREKAQAKSMEIARKRAEAEKRADAETSKTKPSWEDYDEAFDRWAKAQQSSGVEGYLFAQEVAAARRALRSGNEAVLGYMTSKAVFKAKEFSPIPFGQ